MQVIAADKILADFAQILSLLKGAGLSSPHPVSSPYSRGIA